MKRIIIQATTVAMMLLLVTPVQAAQSSTSVSYEYDYTIMTDDPDYAVSIPAGIEFTSDTPDADLGIDVKLVLPEGSNEVPNGCKVEVSVASKKGYYVSLDGLGKEDPVEYQLEYGGEKLFGKDNMQKIGVLEKSSDSSKSVLVLKGTGFVLGYATKTGNHTDILTYSITDRSVY